MNQQPNQQQHDRTNAQYGRQPAEMRTGTETGPSQQPQFGNSTGQMGSGGQRPTTRGSTQPSMQGMQNEGMQRGGMQSEGMQRGGMQGKRMGSDTRSTPSHSFDDHMTDELWIALEDFGELSHVAAWCATQCATDGPELGACARVCQDIAEIAALNEMLIARDSMFGPEMADTFMQVAVEGVQTLRQYQHRHPHVRETAATLERTMNSCEALLRQVGGSRTGGGRRGTGARSGSQGTGERGQHGQGTSNQPTSLTEMSGQGH